MNNQQLQLASFEQAQRLKKAGFDWPCLRYYFIDGGYLDDDVDRYEYNWNSPDEDDLFKRLYGDSDEMDVSDIASAPTVALALKWMRDVKHINYQIDSDVLWNEDNGKHEKLWRSGRGDFTLISTGWKKSYEDTESALLDELLTLIEK